MCLVLFYSFCDNYHVLCVVAVVTFTIVNHYLFMENYFVLLELPQTGLTGFENNMPVGGFWKNARKQVMDGYAKIISSRPDTGVSEELKSYLGHITAYTTFVLLQTALEPADLTNIDSLLPVLAQSINIHSDTEILDQNATFRVLAQS